MSFVYADVESIRQEAELAALKGRTIELSPLAVIGLLDALETAEEEAEAADEAAQDLERDVDTAEDTVADLKSEVEELEAENANLQSLVTGGDA